MTVAAGKTCGWSKVGDVCIYVSAAGPPSEADWNEYLIWFKKEGARASLARSELLALVFDRSPGPNANQRKLLNDATAGVKLRSAVMTKSAVARGIVTAMNWFKSDSYKAFTPEEIEGAMTFLNTPKPMMGELRAAVQSLASTLDAG